MDDKLDAPRYGAGVGHWVDIEAQRGTTGILCGQCRHRVGVGFEGLSAAETDFMLRFKIGHEHVAAGGWIGGPPGERPFLLTLYSGWALRCRSQSGELRAAGIALPGELVGVEMVTGVATDLRLRALTDVTYCRFEPSRWHELLAVPSIADRIVRIEAIARIETEDQLLAAGRSATAGVCHFFLSLCERLAARRLAREDGFGLPLPLATIAECLNLTPVHLRRVLRRLEAEGVLTIAGHRARILDPARLRALAGTPARAGLRPLV